MASQPAIIDDDPPVGDPPATEPAAKEPVGDPPVKEPSPDPVKEPAANDDWRAQLAGDDDKLLGFLGRYPSPKAFAEAAKKDRAAAASALKPLGKDPSEEEIAAYRKNFGVPEKPEAYLESLPDGLVVGEDDMPIVGDFAKAMHAINAPDEVVKSGIKWYYDHVESQMAEEAEAVDEAKRVGVDALRDEWGPDYRRNLNIMHSHLETLPEPVREAFTFGKGADGIPLGYNPEILKWLTGLALDKNPLATVVPGAGANQASAVADEITKIEKMMREDRAGYNRDVKIQERYRELIRAQEKLK